MPRRGALIYRMTSTISSRGSSLASSLFVRRMLRNSLPSSSKRAPRSRGKASAKTGRCLRLRPRSAAPNCRHFRSSHRMRREPFSVEPFLSSVASVSSPRSNDNSTPRWRKGERAPSSSPVLRASESRVSASSFRASSRRAFRRRSSSRGAEMPRVADSRSVSSLRRFVPRSVFASTTTSRRAASAFFFTLVRRFPTSAIPRRRRGTSACSVFRSSSASSWGHPSPTTRAPSYAARGPIASAWAIKCGEPSSHS